MDTSQSHSRRVLGQARERAVEALTRSKVGGVLRLAKRSSLYRWVTSKPEPDVVVVDLRETYTVGPLLGVLDRATHVVERAWHQSRFETLADAAGEQLDESHVGSFLKAVVKRPKPPSDG